MKEVSDYFLYENAIKNHDEVSHLLFHCGIFDPLTESGAINNLENFDMAFNQYKSFIGTLTTNYIDDNIILYNFCYEITKETFGSVDECKISLKL